MDDPKTTAPTKLTWPEDHSDQEHLTGLLIDNQIRNCIGGQPLGDLCGLDCECAINAGIDPSKWMEQYS